MQLLFAVFGKVEQPVKLGIEAIFEQAAIGDDSGRAVHKGALQQGRAVVHVVPRFEHLGDALGHAGGRARCLSSCRSRCSRATQGIEDIGQGVQAVAQGNKVARCALVQAYAGREALEVIHIFKGLAQGGAAGVIGIKIRHRILYARDGADFAPGVAQHVFKQPAAHGGHGVVQRVAQGSLALAAIEAGKNFKIALCHIVDDQAAAQIKRGKGHEVVGAAHLGLAEVGQQRTAGPHELWLALKTKCACLAHALSLHNALCGAFELKLGCRHTHKPYALQNATLGQFCTFRNQQFAGGQLLSPLPQLSLALEFNARPLPRRNIGPGQPASAASSWRAQGRKVVVAFAGKVGIFHHCAGGDYAGNSAFYQPLGGLGVFCLVADGNVVALVDELGNVALNRMPRHAAHGNGVFRILAAAGEGNLKFARRHLGVVVEQFIKVAHAVKQQSIGMLCLDAHVLLKHGGQLNGSFRHRDSWGWR